MKQRRPLRKMLCECGRPLDRTLPTHDRQCRRCFNLNKFALAMHERTRYWMNAEEWSEAQSNKRLRRWLKKRAMSSQ